MAKKESFTKETDVSIPSQNLERDPRAKTLADGMQWLKSKSKTATWY